MVNSYEEIMGTPMDPEDHSANNMKAPTQQYAGDVTPLHPAGTFSRNTQGGDIVNGMAQALRIGPPNNVIKFPKK